MSQQDTVTVSSTELFRSLTAEQIDALGIAEGDVSNGIATVSRDKLIRFLSDKQILLIQATPPEQPRDPGIMTRAEFEAMPPINRHEFVVKNKGKVVG